MKEINTIIIGAGQAGLSTSYYLKQENIPHILLEEHQPGENWKNSRWDSFSLVTPNWMNQLPGFPYTGEDPHGFLSKEEVVQYIEDYVKKFDLPILTGQRVLSLNKDEKGRYLIQTKNEIYYADHVVVATGIYHKPRIPQISKEISSDMYQIHSNEYKNPQVLPPGNVIVVGAGRSGVQIAYELQKTGRHVFLCVGTAGDIPFSYRGYHGTFWLNRLSGYRQDEDSKKGFMTQEENRYIDRKGKMSIEMCRQEGVTLLGRLIHIQDGKAQINRDLHKNMAQSQGFLKAFEKAVDQYLAEENISKSKEKVGEGTMPTKIDDLQEIQEVDFSKENITSIIWSTGYEYGYDWIEIPVLDENGFPIQKRGITPEAGLYFIGLKLNPKMKEDVNFGVGLYAVGEDAKIIVEDILKK